MTDEELQAFELLRQPLIAPPVLALPKRKGLYILDSDACEFKLGCTLLQEQDDNFTAKLVDLRPK